MGWHRDQWLVTDVDRCRFSLSAKAARTVSPENTWWLTVVYGPQVDHEKIEFLEELLDFRNSTTGDWMLCGDFNMIYMAADKNNDRLDRRAMRRFRAFLGAAQLEELHLHGR